MKPDYKNWMPKGMVLGFLAGALAFLALSIIIGCTPLLAAGTLKTVLTVVFALAALFFCALTIWGIMLYRAFDYNGKRKMSRQTDRSGRLKPSLPYPEESISSNARRERPFPAGFLQYKKGIAEQKS